MKDTPARRAWKEITEPKHSMMFVMAVCCVTIAMMAVNVGQVSGWEAFVGTLIAWVVLVGLYWAMTAAWNWIGDKLSR